MSQKEIATALNLSQPFINMVLKGKKRLTPENIRKIISIFDFDENTHYRLSLAAIQDKGYFINMPKEENNYGNS
jgi:plasmid maintenance system antidote protein VapI